MRAKMLRQDISAFCDSRVALIFLACVALTPVLAAKTPPHIVFILADDVGWADTSLFGSCQIPTPNLDALAAHGILLNQYYTLQTCSPSRSSLMTGIYAIRMGLQHDVLLPGEQGGLNLTVPTLAEQLKKLGYQTHALGKWHLGSSSIQYTPTRRGFDTFFGHLNMQKFYFSQILTFAKQCGFDFWDNEKLVSDAGGAYDTHLIVDRAVDIISHHDTNKPMFMYLSTLAAHGQTNDLTTDAPEENLAKFPYIGDRNRTLLAGTLDALDESVGRVVDALHGRGMLSNTLLVFTSDNGGIPWGVCSNTGSNWPLRGTKGTLWEGGVRVPALVWSPLLKPGSRIIVPRLVHVVDWMPTLYSAAGGDISDLGAIDGLNLWPALSAAKSSEAESWPRRELLVNSDRDSGLSAYRDGDYKLIVIEKPEGSQKVNPFKDPGLQQHVPIPGNTQPWCRNANTAAAYLDSRMTSSLSWNTLQKLRGDDGLFIAPEGWRQHAAVQCDLVNGSVSRIGLYEGTYLFDLSRDPCEVTNLATQLPSVVAKLSEKLKVYAAVAVRPKEHEIDPRGRPGVNNCTWGPWEEMKQTSYHECECMKKPPSHGFLTNASTYLYLSVLAIVAILISRLVLNQ
ncbi:arylsulfatase J-like isoform X1 [Dermacentor silvarum]|uniref:arylsulfatase J-like isoform X1 n=1 Tax=Dermacentor silvarum TaxID=543639 RepID=UPI00210099A8|nr:arylsulfatase J-like isoform X1 [Dermacentor silvarum]